MSASLRLFIDPPFDGPANMAVDDCLLDEVAAGDPPALRLYRWDPPTLSLGRFQRYDDPARSAPGLAALPVVRRVTGGGAILHADELTYSLALPVDHPLAGRRPADLYAWMHDRIAAAVASLGGHAAAKGGGRLTARGGPFLCFQRHAPFDLMAGPAKLAGSAQRRTRRGLLQHGSVVLIRSHPIQPSGSLADLIGRQVGFEAFAEALVAAVSEAGVRLTPPEPSAVDPARLAAHRRRHVDADWLRRR